MYIFKILADLKLSKTGPSNIHIPLLTSDKFDMKFLLELIEPATQSDVPLINFVNEWITTSAPKLMGVIDIGLKVLSTTNLIAFFFCNFT